MIVTRTLALVALAAVVLPLACSSPPAAPLPEIETSTPSERLPIDGLWQTTGEETVYLQLERGRMYLQSGFSPDERHGTLVHAEIHQNDPRSYRCRAPVEALGSATPGEIRWQPCVLALENDGQLTARTLMPGGQKRIRRYKVVALADEVWFDAQRDSWYIVSAREAHRPPPTVVAIAPVPKLPPAPEPTAIVYSVPTLASRFGRYHALVVGSGDYLYLPAVATAESDADAVAEMLEERYGFEVTNLRNPTLADFAAALDRYERELETDDNLLIYYAGHGFLSEELARCFWFPVDASGDDSSQGVSNEDVAVALRDMKAKHVMIVADSCFSAGERREAGLDDTDNGVYERLSKLRTRVVLTSGGLEPIQDGRGGGHSVFTGAFLEALGDNREVLDGTTLFSEVRRIVAQASQTPEYADIRGAEHGGGDFLFVPVP